MTPRRFRPALALLLALGAGCAQLPTLSTSQALERLNIASTKLFASDGSLIANLHGEINRDIVSLGTIPDNVQNAVIAIEDQRFWTHRGVDAISIGRALVSNVGAAASDSNKVQGGSTLTQQLVKNIYFQKPERTLRRKVTEARVTYQFEQKYSKKKILEMYLNTIYLGRGVYGVQTAARAYFGKEAKALTLGEAAFLAGLIHEPARYDWTDKDSADVRNGRKQAALDRRRVVLSKMHELGFISVAQADRSAAEPLKLQARSEQEWQHPYFVDMVLRQLGVLRSSKNVDLDHRFDFLGGTYEERARNVYRGGLRIYTTLDPQVQSAAEEAVDKVLPKNMTKLSAALAAVEPGTGYIRAIVGGRDYYPDGCDESLPAAQQTAVCRLAKVNLSLGALGGGSGRQPGSSFKPIVLAAAVARGVTLRTYFDSSPFEKAYPGGVWKVRNYEGSGGGSMDLIEGTVHSVNAVYAHLEIDGLGDGEPIKGSTRVAEMARKLGIGFPTRGDVRAKCGSSYGKNGGCTPADDVPAVALGAKEVSPLEMASAYSTFANEGVHVEPSSVARITDASGRVLYEANPVHSRVLPRPVALGVTHVLGEVVDRGTGTRAKLGRPAAGKTGTSQEWRDAWFVGYVPQLTGAVWVGNPIPTKNKSGQVEVESMTPANGYPLKVVGGSFPAMIWQYFMTKATGGLPIQSFADPPQDLFGTAFSSPGPEAVVPDVLGMQRDEAVAALQSLGFAAREATCLDLRAAPGTVVRQTPPGGTMLATDQGVEICVAARTMPMPTPRAGSPGFGQTNAQGTVPDVIGTSRARAQSMLSEAGYSVDAAGECDPSGTSEVGRVWRQWPEGGTSMPQGWTVQIWYNRAGC